MRQDKKALTLKTLNKSNVWDIQENDIFRMWGAAEKDTDLKDNMRHYSEIIRSAFNVEEVKIDKPEIIKKYEGRGFKIGQVRVDDSTKIKLAIKLIVGAGTILSNPIESLSTSDKRKIIK